MIANLQTHQITYVSLPRCVQYQQKYQFFWAKELPLMFHPSSQISTCWNHQAPRDSPGQHGIGNTAVHSWFLFAAGKRQATAVKSSEIPNDCDILWSKEPKHQAKIARNLKVTTRHDQGLTDAWMHFPGTELIRRIVNVTYPYVSCSLSPWNKAIPLFLPITGRGHPEVRLIEEERLERRCHRWEHDHQQQEGKNHPIGPPNTKPPSCGRSRTVRSWKKSRQTQSYVYNRFMQMSSI